MSFDEKDLPDRLTFFLTIIFSMLTEDMTFHFLHKLLHTKLLYPHIHKIHHEYKSTIGIAAVYSHPIEYIVGVMLPAGAPALLLGSSLHLSTFLFWSLLRLSESIDGHSGYEFPWSPFRLLPFGTSARYHSFHHEKNIGNYSSMCSIWDTIMGTNVHYYKAIKEEDKGNKKD
jgi:sterol desaturase/sphingolipid hydroxylase (fatty acid hydroxylase superfamily)